MKAADQENRDLVSGMRQGAIISVKKKADSALKDFGELYTLVRPKLAAVQDCIQMCEDSYRLHDALPGSEIVTYTFGQYPHKLPTAVWPYHP